MLGYGLGGRNGVKRLPELLVDKVRVLFGYRTLYIFSFRLVTFSTKREELILDLKMITRRSPPRKWARNQLLTVILNPNCCPPSYILLLSLSASSSLANRSFVIKYIRSRDMNEMGMAGVNTGVVQQEDKEDIGEIAIAI